MEWISYGLTRIWNLNRDGFALKKRDRRFGVGTFSEFIVCFAETMNRYFK